MATHLRRSLAFTACGNDATRCMTETDPAAVDCRSCIQTMHFQLTEQAIDRLTNPPTGGPAPWIRTPA